MPCNCDIKKDLNRLINLVQRMANVSKDSYAIYKTNSGWNFCEIQHYVGNYLKLIEPNDL